MVLEKERKEVVAYGKEMLRRGLITGTFGNLSIYNEEEGMFAICPSGMPYDMVAPEDVAVLKLDGTVVAGRRKPSSEVDMHRIIYQNKQHARAVVHTHSPAATAVACLGHCIPPIHYLIAYSGYEVPCTEKYVQFGTYALAESAIRAMGENDACLLANHGLLTCGEDMEFAMNAAQQIEFCADLYLRTKGLGEQKLLSKEELDRVRAALRSYGK